MKKIYLILFVLLCFNTKVIAGPVPAINLSIPGARSELPAGVNLDPSSQFVMLNGQYLRSPNGRYFLLVNCAFTPAIKPALVLWDNVLKKILVKTDLIFPLGYEWAGSTRYFTGVLVFDFRTDGVHNIPGEQIFPHLNYRLITQTNYWHLYPGETPFWNFLCGGFGDLSKSCMKLNPSKTIANSTTSNGTINNYVNASNFDYILDKTILQQDTPKLLRIRDDGNLVIVNAAEQILWQTGTAIQQIEALKNVQYSDIVASFNGGTALYNGIGTTGFNNTKIIQNDNLTVFSKKAIFLTNTNGGVSDFIVNKDAVITMQLIPEIVGSTLKINSSKTQKAPTEAATTPTKALPPEVDDLSWFKPRSFDAYFDYYVNQEKNFIEYLLKASSAVYFEKNKGIESSNITEQGKVVVYPNPTKGSLNIEFSRNEEKLDVLYVFDSNGKMIKQFSSDSNLDLSDLANGIYYCNIISNKQTYVSKIIKN